MPKKRAAIYTRISQDRQGLEAGVQRQEDDCRARIAERGWTLSGVFSDNDISASRYSRRRRTSFHELLAQVEARQIDVVVAYHPKRLVRQVSELEQLITLAEQTGCAFEFVMLDMPLDLNTAAGRAMARIAAAFGAMESEEQSERIRRARLEEARKGLRSTGGARPFGYEDGGMEIRESEAIAIREAVQRVLTGSSAFSIAKTWNDAGLLTPHGNTWTTGKVSVFLRQPSLAGLRVYRRTGEVYNAQWPAIISAEEHELLKRRLKPSGTKPAKRRGLLSGLLRCAECGKTLMYSYDDGRTRYTCDRSRNGGCGRVRVAQGHELEAALLSLAASSVMEEGFTRAADALGVDLGGASRELIDRFAANEDPTSGPDRESILLQLRELEDRDAELVEMLGAGEIRRPEFNRLRQQIADEREQLDADLRVSSEGAFERIDALDDLVIARTTGERDLTAEELERLRVAVRAALPGGMVYVRPGVKSARSFDPSRLEFR